MVIPTYRNIKTLLSFIKVLNIKLRDRLIKGLTINDSTIKTTKTI